METDKVNIGMHTDYVTYRYGEKATLKNILAAKKAKNDRLNELKCLYRYRGVNEIQRLVNNSILGNPDTMYLSSPNSFNDPYDFREPNTIQVSKKIRKLMVEESIHRVDLANMLRGKKSALYTTKLRKTLTPLPSGELKPWGEWVNELNKIEQKYKPVYTEGADDLRTYIEKRAKEEHDEMVRKSRELVGVACFSEVKNSMLMWSHYAGNHRGICVEYDTEVFSERDPMHGCKLKEILHPVTYTNDISHLFEQARKFRDDEMPKEKEGNFVSELGLLKAKEWEYEKEWRLIRPLIPDDQNQHPEINQRLIALHPSKIYLGARISIENKALLRAVFKDRDDVELIQMSLKEGSFELEECPFD